MSALHVVDMLHVSIYILHKWVATMKHDSTSAKLCPTLECHDGNNKAGKSHDFNTHQRLITMIFGPIGVGCQGISRRGATIIDFLSVAVHHPPIAVGYPLNAKLRAMELLFLLDC